MASTSRTASSGTATPRAAGSAGWPRIRLSTVAEPVVAAGSVRSAKRRPTSRRAKRRPATGTIRRDPIARRSSLARIPRASAWHARTTDRAAGRPEGLRYGRAWVRLKPDATDTHVVVHRATEAADI